MKHMFKPLKKTTFFFLFVSLLTYISATFSGLYPHYTTLFLPEFPLNRTLWTVTWLAMSLLLSISYFCYLRFSRENRKTRPFWLQSFMCICYPLLLFYKQWYLFAFAWTVLMTFRAFQFLKENWKIQMITFSFFLLYFLECLYFTYLTFGIYWYN